MSDKEQATRLADELEFHGRFAHESEQQAAARRVARNTEAAALLRRWPDGEPVAQVSPHCLRPKPDGTEWCREVLLYSPNNEGDKLNGVNTRVKLYTAPPAERIAALEAALEQARVALRDARASLDGRGHNAGLIAHVDAALRAIEEVR